MGVLARPLSEKIPLPLPRHKNAVQACCCLVPSVPPAGPVYRYGRGDGTLLRRLPRMLQRKEYLWTLLCFLYEGPRVPSNDDDVRWNRTRDSELLQDHPP